MRVAVQQFLVRQQIAAGLQGLDDERVRLPDAHAAEQRDVGIKTTIVIHRIVDLQAIAAADHVVVQAVSGCGMHGAGAGIGGDVVAHDDRDFALLERVPQQHAFECLAGRVRHDFSAFAQAKTRQRGFTQTVGQNQQAFGCAYQRVLEVGMQRHRLVGRQRPRRGGPDDDLNWLVDGGDVKPLGEIGAIGHRKADVDRGRGLVLVFDFGLGQRRSTVHAPVHRLGALIEVARCLNLAQRTQGVGLELEIHGAVGMVPVAEYAQPDEIGLLSLDLDGSVFAAQLAKFRGFDGLAVSLFHL